VAVADWFCPITVVNVQQNAHVAVVVWDAGAGIGYQLLGQVEEMRELNLMGGYVPGEEDMPPLPQTERELLVHVNTILTFTHRPHADVPE
jgi:hypothetical protein